MALNRAAVRRDLPYLRRRVKPAAAVADVAGAGAAAGAGSAAPAPTTAPSGSGGLDLRPAGAATPAPSTSGGLDLRPAGAATPTPSTSGGLNLRPATSAAPTGRPAGAPGRGSEPGGGSARRPARPSLPGPFPAPTIDEVRELGAGHPVLRLDARRSAIGSLIVSGAYAIAWESTDLVTGALTLTSGGVETVGTPVMTPGNRALVGFDDGDAIVALRHLRDLRRALFVGNGSEPIGVQLFDGAQVTLSASVGGGSAGSGPAGSGAGDGGSAGGDRMFVLTLLRIGAFIELRAEPVARDVSPAALHREFGYQMTARLDARQPRTR